MTALIIICTIAVILLVWFRTDAFLEYTRMFRLNFLSDYKGFAAKYHDDVSLTYLAFLRQYHDCFFIRLITCPVCLTVWLGLIFGLLSWIVLIPIYIIFGLMLYLIIDRLLG